MLKKIEYSPDTYVRWKGFFGPHVRKPAKVAQSGRGTENPIGKGTGIVKLQQFLTDEIPGHLPTRVSVLRGRSYDIHLWELSPQLTAAIVERPLDGRAALRRLRRQRHAKRFGSWRVLPQPIRVVRARYAELLRRRDGAPIQSELEVSR